MIELSRNMLLVAFIMYVLASIAFVLTVVGKKWSNRSEQQHIKRWGWIGFSFCAIGFLSQTMFVILRWIIGGHIPTSNMFEFLTFLGYCVALGFIILFLIYRVPVLGIFAMPAAFIVIAYASVFPKEVTPLIPALQSYWLKIHVTMAAAGEGIFAVGFAAGLMYLVRTVDQSVKSKSRFWLEGILCLVLMLVGFIGSSLLFGSMNYEAKFTMDVASAAPGASAAPVAVTYNLPAIAGPQNATLSTQGVMQPLFTAPSWMEGKDAARKLNTTIWSVFTGLGLYLVLRLVARKRLGLALQPMLADLDPEIIDEITYRAIAIGYPIFTLGALIFAMIWASEAWGRFWGWDPKEVWALITWLFYTAYLHLRLSKGWLGMKSAWMAVFGFVFVMVTLVVVNLVIVGLHSYAQVG